MIITLFPHKGPSKSAVNYCLSDYDHNKNIREVKPKILDGDAELTKSIDKLTSKYAVQATSGVISFRDNEDLNEEQKKQLIEDFKDTFVGSELKNKVNCLFIEHRDKGNLEIHFIINNVVIDDKPKFFNPFPPGHEIISNNFTALQNYNFGFEQVQQKDIFKQSLSNEEQKALKVERKHGFKNLKRKDSIHKFLVEEIKKGNIKNRNELIECLKEMGLTITRNNDDFISVKTDDGSNIRLKGDIYKKNSEQSYRDLFKEKKEEIKKPFDLQKTKEQFEKSMNKRIEFNNKRYNTNDKITLDIKHKTNTLNNNNDKNIINKEDVKNNSISSNAELVISTSAQQQLVEATAMLTNAKTHEERAKAMIAIARAKLAVERESSMNEERRKQALSQEAQRIKQLNSKL
ncbi:MAG TPA: relaxase/mobilization nuclease domain-containing protein [Alcaligenaceae bacterium]|nr:relaxase/mobilization nuclease domain-containing protein [Alcaligenaceae bacterium]